MNKQIIVIILSAVFISGCASTTARQPTDVSNLRIKIAQLERKLEDRDQKINDMDYDMHALAEQVQKLSRAEQTSSSKSVSTVKPRSSSSSSKSDKRIVRVPVDIQKIQTALKNAGYYDGTVDGKLGRQSKAAIVQFQKDHDLKSDGIIGKQTWDELKSYL